MYLSAFESLANMLSAIDTKYPGQVDNKDPLTTNMQETAQTLSQETATTPLTTNPAETLTEKTKPEISCNSIPGGIAQGQTSQGQTSEGKETQTQPKANVLKSPPPPSMHAILKVVRNLISESIQNYNGQTTEKAKEQTVDEKVSAKTQSIKSNENPVIIQKDTQNSKDSKDSKDVTFFEQTNSIVINMKPQPYIYSVTSDKRPIHQRFFHGEHPKIDWCTRSGSFGKFVWGVVGSPRVHGFTIDISNQTKPNEIYIVDLIVTLEDKTKIQISRETNSWISILSPKIPISEVQILSMGDPREINTYYTEANEPHRVSISNSTFSEYILQRHTMDYSFKLNKTLVKEDSIDPKKKEEELYKDEESCPDCKKDRNQGFYSSILEFIESIPTWINTNMLNLTESWRRFLKTELYKAFMELVCKPSLEIINKPSLQSMTSATKEKDSKQNMKSQDTSTPKEKKSLLQTIPPIIQEIKLSYAELKHIFFWCDVSYLNTFDFIIKICDDLLVFLSVLSAI